jgi:hypothetical protein
MDQFPPGAWELGRPNIIEWTRDLTAAPPSAVTNAARDRLFELGRRLDILMRVVMQEEEVDSEEGAEEQVEDELLAQGTGVEEEEEPEIVENEITVRPLASLLYFV